jgi:hypothetical protein
MAVSGFRPTEHPLPNARELFDSLIARYGHSRTVEYVHEFIEELQDLIDEEPEMQELFGDKNSDLPEDESEIVFDNGLSHEEKASKLKALRAGKAKLAKDPTPIKTP